jgi:hypothetical protein
VVLALVVAERVRSEGGLEECSHEQQGVVEVSADECSAVDRAV